MPNDKPKEFFDVAPANAPKAPAPTGGAPRRRVIKSSPQLAVEAAYVGKAKLALDIDPRVKAEAQDTAARLNLSLTSVVTDLLRKFIADNPPT